MHYASSPRVSLEHSFFTPTLFTPAPSAQQNPTHPLSLSCNISLRLSSLTTPLPLQNAIPFFLPHLSHCWTASSTRTVTVSVLFTAPSIAPALSGQTVSGYWMNNSLICKYNLNKWILYPTKIESSKIKYNTNLKEVS